MLTVPLRAPLGGSTRGRGSAGRASPLQGEGQEFESPRLHGGVKTLTTGGFPPPRASLEVRRRGYRPTARRPVREPPASQERRPFERAHVVVPCAGSREEG